MDLKELEDDKVIQEKLKNLTETVSKIQKILDVALEADTTKFNTKEKVDFDLFLVYSLNTLYWMYLRTKGEDPNQHAVKSELNRIKTYMIQTKQLEDSQTIRPKVDKAAAKRFVKHAIHHHTDKELIPNKKTKNQ